MEVDSVILVDPFQPGIYYGSVKTHPKRIKRLQAFLWDQSTNPACLTAVKPHETPLAG